MGACVDFCEVAARAASGFAIDFYFQSFEQLGFEMVEPFVRAEGGPMNVRELLDLGEIIGSGVAKSRGEVQQVFVGHF